VNSSTGKHLQSSVQFSSVRPRRTRLNGHGVGLAIKNGELDSRLVRFFVTCMSFTFDFDRRCYAAVFNIFFSLDVML